MFGRRMRQTMAHANFRLNEAGDLLKLANALIDDLQDGVGVRIEVDANAAQTLLAILGGSPGELPLTIKIDPTVDAD